MEKLEHTKGKSSQKFLLSILCLVCLILVGTSVYFFMQSRKNDDQTGKQKKIIAKLRQVIQLPKEDPVAVTVADKRKLTNKSLAAHVQNKDVLFIFGKSKQLIIYRPSTGKVVDMLSFGSQNDLPKKD